MSGDVAAWSRGFVSWFECGMKPLMGIALFCSKLTNRIGARSFWLCIAYFLVSSLWTRWVLPSEGGLKALSMEQEALWLRRSGRIVEWSEEIAFWGGMEAELRSLDAAYCALYGALYGLSGYDWVCAVARNYAVRYLGIAASFCSLLPMMATESEPTEFLLNNLHDLVQIGLAFRDLLRCAKELDKVKALSVRIADLHRVLRHEVEADLERRQRGNAMAIPLHSHSVDGDSDGGAAGGDEAVRFEAVSVETPDRGKVLLSELDLTITLGENVVICGPNGSGKSSLFRCVWGIWECSKGRITVNLQREEIAFLPSRCYLVPALSIKEQVLYPDGTASDEAVIEILSECGLGKMGGFELLNEPKQETFWLNLSDGEKQLIALCRAVIKKPKLLFIDEALSNLSQDRVHWLFAKLEALSITAVTISHRADDDALIQKHHRKKLTLFGDGSGRWTVERI